MKTKHGLLFGFAVISIAAIFTFAGCDDGSGGGSGGGGGGVPSGTIKMGQTQAQEAENEFTLTLAGGLTWTDDMTTNGFTLSMDVYLFEFDGNVSADNPGTNDVPITVPLNFDFTFTLTEDPTVLTVKLGQASYNDSGTQKYYFGSGKLKLKDPTGRLYPTSESQTEDIGSYIIKYITKEAEPYHSVHINEIGGLYPNGKLTLAADPVSVKFNIAKHN